MLGKAFENKNDVKQLELKTQIVSSYVYANLLNWELAISTINSAETKYKEMMDDVDYMKEYSYNIINDVYNWMISRKKDIEVRILKEKSQAIQVGDIISFNNQDKIGQFIKVKVIKKTIVKNIEELNVLFSRIK